MKIVLLLISVLLISLSPMRGDNAGPSAPVIPFLPKSALLWDAVEKSVELAAMTNIAGFTFWATNVSDGDVTIHSTETSCDCTVAQAAKLLPWRLAPGEGGSLKVNLNTRGRFGLVTKTITVHSSHGSQVLTIHARIPLTPAPANVSARQRDMMAALQDRQVVFQGSCAACHALPAAGKTGEVLFVKACGICHTAEHRAEMVPDLAALQSKKDEEYWRSWVTHGKPGSLMPAFAMEEGGILDTNQIESLVGYLLKKYPAGSKAAAESLAH
ncbi:MAG TPA: DUF1573 domain-containing protein [Verrucomicrobiae bacterium]|nr:DUF1573 domain-containing protein [Verrucomicrobiae bacterium]